MNYDQIKFEENKNKPLTLKLNCVLRIKTILVKNFANFFS